ncbi:MAG: HAD family phosphatase [Olegusella sp.]|nr:HAD family phosphatase [Olegusella sp.]
MIQAAIFDMDGLMYDTEPLWYKAWTPALARFGLTFDDSVAVECRGTSGVYRDAVIARHYPGQDAHGIGTALDEEAAQIIARELTKKPGLDELLVWLSAQGVPCVVASSSGHEMIRGNLERTGVAGYFATEVSGQDVQKGKPEPDIFLAAAAAVGADPTRSMVLEDSFAGVRAGRAGGFVTVMVPDLAQPTDEIAGLCDAVCTSLLEVRDLLAAGRLG